MSDTSSRSVRFRVIGAVAVVLVLSGTLVAGALRGLGSPAVTHLSPPPATVPAPKPCDLSALEFPCWGCLWAEKWPLRYRTDLDMLAPLGNGPANAAGWFAEFAKPGGRRYAEAEAAMGRRVPHGPILPIAPKGLDALPPDDPLLLEAEPWCDQATMRFYPEVFAVRGGQTQLPNNLFTVTLARSWIARGTDAANLDDAMADFRRVIRLGRLLRQDDVVLIDDLLGLSYIRWGAEAIYDRARKEGRTDLALLAAVVAGEGAPQRHLTAARMTAIEITPYLRQSAAEVPELDVPETRFNAISETAISCPDRRFRLEAALDLRLIAALGPEARRTSARGVLDRLAGDPDPIVAANARWCLATPVAQEESKVLGSDPRYQ